MVAVPKPVKQPKVIKYNSLQQKTPLRRRTPLKAKAPMKKTPPKRSYTHLQKRGYCAICGKWSRYTQWHHIVYRSHGGDESDMNMIEVGGAFSCDCHGKIHAGEISVEEVRQKRADQGSYLKTSSDFACAW